MVRRPKVLRDEVEYTTMVRPLLFRNEIMWYRVTLTPTCSEMISQLTLFDLYLRRTETWTSLFPCQLNRKLNSGGSSPEVWTRVPWKETGSRSRKVKVNLTRVPQSQEITSRFSGFRSLLEKRRTDSRRMRTQDNLLDKERTTKFGPHRQRKSLWE